MSLASLFGGTDVVVEPEYRRAALRELVNDVPWWMAANMPGGFRAWMLFRCREQVYGFEDEGEIASFPNVIC